MAVTSRYNAMELTFNSDKGRNWGILIARKGRTVDLSGYSAHLAADPIYWEEKGADEMDISLRGATGKLRLVIDGEKMTRAQFAEVFECGLELGDMHIAVYADYSRASSGYTINGTMYFQGLIKPDIARQPLEPYPYEVELDIVDYVAACDDIKAENMLTRTASSHYLFSEQNIINWWKTDMGVQISNIYAYGLAVDPVARLFVMDYMDVNENYNNTPATQIKAKSYGDILSELLGTTWMQLRGSNLILYRYGSTSATWKKYTPDFSSVTNVADSTVDCDSIVDYEGCDHQVNSVEKKSYYYVEKNRERGFEFKIDSDINEEIASTTSGTATTLGQGDIKVHKHTNRIKCVYEPNRITSRPDYESMKVSGSEKKGSLQLCWDNSDTNNYTLIEIKSKYPVLYDDMILKGCLTLKKPGEQDGTRYDEEKTDFTHKFKFEVLLNDTPAFTSGYDLCMRKDFKGSETSQFYDRNCDTYEDQSKGDAIGMINGLMYNNFEGIHIMATDLQASKQYGYYIGIRIWVQNGQSTVLNANEKLYIDNLEVSRLRNVKLPERNVGDVEGDEIKRPFGAQLPGEGLWSYDTHAQTKIVKIDGVSPKNTIFPLNCFCKVSASGFGVSSYPIAVSYNPREERGTISLKNS